MAFILESREDEVLVKQTIQKYLLVKNQVGFKVDFQPKSVLKGIFAYEIYKIYILYYLKVEMAKLFGFNKLVMLHKNSKTRLNIMRLFVRNINGIAIFFLKFLYQLEQFLLSRVHLLWAQPFPVL